MAVETKVVKGINFVKVMLEVESLLQSGWGLQTKGMMYNGVQFYVPVVRGIVESTSKDEETTVVNVVNENSDASAVTTEEPVKSATTTKAAKKQPTKPASSTTSPVSTGVDIKSE